MLIEKATFLHKDINFLQSSNWDKSYNLFVSNGFSPKITGVPECSYQKLEGSCVSVSELK